jgi:hypothetical protein
MSKHKESEHQQRTDRQALRPDEVGNLLGRVDLTWTPNGKTAQVDFDGTPIGSIEWTHFGAGWLPLNRNHETVGPLQSNRHAPALMTEALAVLHLLGRAVDPDT